MAEGPETNELIAAVRRMQSTLDGFVASVEVISQRQKTEPLERIYRDMDLSGERNALYQAIADLEAKFIVYRQRLTRDLVDEEGMSLTEVAKLIGRSRQWVTRLYRGDE